MYVGTACAPSSSPEVDSPALSRPPRPLHYCTRRTRSAAQAPPPTATARARSAAPPPPPPGILQDCAWVGTCEVSVGPQFGTREDGGCHRGSGPRRRDSHHRGRPAAAPITAPPAAATPTTHLGPRRRRSFHSAPRRGGVNSRGDDPMTTHQVQGWVDEGATWVVGLTRSHIHCV